MSFDERFPPVTVVHTRLLNQEQLNEYRKNGKIFENEVIITNDSGTFSSNEIRIALEHIRKFMRWPGAYRLILDSAKPHTSYEIADYCKRMIPQMGVRFVHGNLTPFVQSLDARNGPIQRLRNRNKI